MEKQADYGEDGYLVGETVRRGRDYLIADLLIHEARQRIVKRGSID